MKNLNDLFEAEFKNLYAMEKQIQHELESFPTVSYNKFDKVLGKMNTSNSKNFEKIKTINSNIGLNPGSTTDSVAQELLQNIKDIEAENLSPEIEQAGMLASFNRLSNYRTANFYTAYRMAKVAKLKTEAKALKKMFKASEKQTAKLMSYSKKKVFKKARA